MEEKNIQEQTEKMTQEAQDLKRALQEIEELKRENAELRNRVSALENGLKTLSEKVSDTFKRLGQWVTEKIDFAKEVMKEDVQKGLDFLDVLKKNYDDLTNRASETTRNLFENVTHFFQEKVPAPFNKVLDFVIARYDAEMDAHFLEVDTKTLNAMEKVAFIIAVEKGKIQDNQAEWVSTLRHEGWKLAEKLGFHQERNKELGNKLLESTKLFGQAIKGIGEVCKEIPQPAVNWIKTNLIDTIPKSVEKIQNAVNTSKDYVKKAFTLSVPEFFKAAKEGVEKAIAEKEGYKMMANGEMVAPTLGEVVKNKLTEPFAPLVEKLKNITQKSSVIIKKEGVYSAIGENTRKIYQKTSMMNMEYLPENIPVSEPKKEDVALAIAKAEKLDNTLSKANETIHFGGHLSENTLVEIDREMTGLNNTLDEAIGKETVEKLAVEVQKEEIGIAIKNDMSLEPIGNYSVDSHGIDSETRRTILDSQANFWNYDIINNQLHSEADWSRSGEFYRSENGDVYMMMAEVTPKGESIEILFSVDLENKTVGEAVRVNEQKEIGGESRTIFDKATGFLAISAINNGIAGKLLASIPVVKESIEKVAEAAKDIASPEKDIKKDDVVRE